MKKQTLLTIMFFVSCAFTAFAQDDGEIINFNISAGYGSLTEKMASKYEFTSGEKRGETINIGGELDYKTMSYSANLEFVIESFGFLLEASYTKGTYDKMNYYEDEAYFKFDPTLFKNVNIIQGAALFGYNIKIGKGRLSFPIYAGIGVSHYSGEPLYGNPIDFLYKVRVKYYLTNKIGVFAGVTGSYGYKDSFDCSQYEGPKFPNNQDFNPDVSFKRLFFEGGLTFQLGRLKERRFIFEPRGVY